jgi:hypothetical protein
MEYRLINTTKNFLNAVTRFKYIYISFLLMSLILSYIPSQVYTSAKIFYFSCAFYLFCFIWYKHFLRPINLYLLMQIPYVAALTIGFWIDIKSLYFWVDVPNFTLPVHIKTFQIGLVALLATSLVLPRERDIIRPNPVWNVENGNNVRFLSYLIILMLVIVSVVQWVYAYTQYEKVLMRYAIVIGGENKEYFMISRMDMIFYCLALIFLVYNAKWYQYKLFWIVILSYFAFKFRTGGRMAATFLGLLIFWRAYLDGKISWVSSRVVKLTAILGGVYLYGFIAAWRETELNFDPLKNIIMPFYWMSLEFMNATFSACYSVFYVLQGLGPTPILPFFDPIIAILPSFLFEDREGLLYFTNWLDSIGGTRNFAPAMGTYLPSQPYLFTGSLVAVFIFCLTLAGGLQRLYRRLLTGARRVDMIRGFIAISYVLVIAIRPDYWIFAKLTMLWLIIMPILLMLIAETIISVGQGRTRTVTQEGQDL